MKADNSAQVLEFVEFFVINDNQSAEIVVEEMEDEKHDDIVNQRRMHKSASFNGSTNVDSVPFTQEVSTVAQ